MTEDNHDMARDMMACDWIKEKCRNSQGYSQNLYAAMCNRDFVKNDVWPLLKGETWSCSWRAAGRIVSELIGSGSYMDWYCSGIFNRAYVSMKADELGSDKDTYDEHLKYKYICDHYVPEAIVTNEIRNDLLRLGWVVLDDGLDDEDK